MKTPLTSIALLLLLAGAAAAQDPEPPPSSVAGELLVKFVDSTAGAQAVDAAMRGDLEKDPKLAEHVAGLGEKLGVPLRVRQLSSGGVIVVQIDLPELVARAARKAGALPGVARAEPRSSEAAVLDVWLAKDAQASETAEWLGEELDLPVSCEEAGERQMKTTLDLGRLTQSVAAGLEEMEEVEYVELNQMMELMG